MLISLTFKEDVKSMSGDGYDKADEVVNDLWQVDEKRNWIFNTVCDLAEP